MWEMNGIMCRQNYNFETRGRSWWHTIREQWCRQLDGWTLSKLTWTTTFSQCSFLLIWKLPKVLSLKENVQGVNTQSNDITLISLRLLINIFTSRNCLCARTPRFWDQDPRWFSHQILSFQSPDQDGGNLSWVWPFQAAFILTLLMVVKIPCNQSIATTGNNRAWWVVDFVWVVKKYFR